MDGLGDRPGPGRRPRLTEAERGRIVALVGTPPPGRLVRGSDGTLAPAAEGGPVHWTLDTRTAAAGAEGIVVGRSQVRRILLAEGVRWRRTRSWTTSRDPQFAPQEPASSAWTPARRRTRRWSAPTSSAR
ncbi:helix-turn-helix domain-containing protein [Carbonactinospora thermoautotrophica]|uniref:helix-turn-helix domain-containing protein n=1 Tax=Carbonactinospora thermoautotrophica TaxID=1469144 RepID=UPI001E4A23FC|nr:helix-turn-helix domain-containing protein [Carbonactinospora thermoautotrophica]